MPSGDAGASRTVDVLIVGSGFSGIYESHLLKNVHKISSMAFEASDEPGGTWNWNRYPGARVDIVSRDYSFKFDKELYDEWNWKELYAPQAELMDYVRHLIERYKLKDVIQFKSYVTGATWDDAAFTWTVEVQKGLEDGSKETQHWTGKHLVLATGCLSAPNILKLPGQDEFKGEIYHTSRWPKNGVDFAGKTVAVIGTGSSAVQTIPVVSETCKDLTVFQRTPTYTIPAWNRTLSPEELEAAKLDSQELRKIGLSHPLGNATFAFTEKTWNDFTPEERESRLEHIWNLGGLNFYGCFADVLVNTESSQGAREFIHRKIKTIVKDPATAEMLCPVHPPGCKRICADTNYYATYNKPNVHLVSVKGNAIKEVGGASGKITLEDGSSYGPFDVIISATGFDAMTGTLMKMNIVGKNGLTIQKAWEAGPVQYIGLLIHGFPNMYHVTGPGSPSVLTNMIVSIEHHCEWIADTIVKMRDEGIKSIEATEEAQDAWVKHVNAVAESTLFYGCSSWYLGANVPGKPQVFMPLVGLPPYVEKCTEVQKTFDGCIVTK